MDVELYIRMTFTVSINIYIGSRMPSYLFYYWGLMFRKDKIVRTGYFYFVCMDDEWPPNRMANLSLVREYAYIDIYMYLSKSK